MTEITSEELKKALEIAEKENKAQEESKFPKDIYTFLDTQRMLRIQGKAYLSYQKCVPILKEVWGIEMSSETLRKKFNDYCRLKKNEDS